MQTTQQYAKTWEFFSQQPLKTEKKCILLLIVRFVSLQSFISHTHIHTHTHTHTCIHTHTYIHIETIYSSICSLRAQIILKTFFTYILVFRDFHISKYKSTSFCWIVFHDRDVYICHWLFALLVNTWVTSSFARFLNSATVNIFAQSILYMFANVSLMWTPGRRIGWPS